MILGDFLLPGSGSAALVFVIVYIYSNLILDYKETSTSYEVGTQFSKETHIRDEDDEMRKFIETEMEKLKGRRDGEEEEDAGSQYLSPEDAALLSLPEHLRYKERQLLWHF